MGKDVRKMEDSLMHLRLIAFDMDGTVLDDHKKILPETREILEEAARQGIVLLPATGRPFCGLSEEVHQLEGVRYVMVCNGAGMYERDTGRCIYEESMELSAFLPLLERLDALEVAADPFLKGEAVMNERKWSLVKEMHLTPELEAYMRTSRKMVADLPAYLRNRGDDIEKLTINFVTEEDGTRRDYDKVLSILSDYPEYNAVPGGMNNIEVTQKGISKGSGLRWIGKQFDISLADMIAFGDSGNDREMLAAAGIGVAMGNAEEEIKAIADFVTASNNENGVAKALKKFCPALAK